MRLGELERHLGDGVIGEIVADGAAEGRREAERRRIMSYPLVIWLMLAMALMPEASYCESLARLAGLLADITEPIDMGPFEDAEPCRGLFLRRHAISAARPAQAKAAASTSCSPASPRART